MPLCLWKCDCLLFVIFTLSSMSWECFSKHGGTSNWLLTKLVLKCCLYRKNLVGRLKGISHSNSRKMLSIYHILISSYPLSDLPILTSLFHHFNYNHAIDRVIIYYPIYHAPLTMHLAEFLYSCKLT